MKNLSAHASQALKMITCAAIGAFFGTAALSFADNDPSTSTVLGEGVVLPYDGYLMLDSAPVNATGQVLQFDLYDAPIGGALQWSETQSVSVVNGRFSVALGKGTKLSSDPSNASFGQVVLDAEKLYLSIQVQDAATNAFVELSGRQAIEASPFSAWAANAADFHVAHDLTVQGDAAVSNTLTVQGAVSAAKVDTATIDAAGGALNLQATDVYIRGAQSRGDGGRAFVHSSGDRLDLNYGGDFAGGTLVHHNLAITGDLDTTGNLQGARLQLDNGIIQRGGGPLTATSDLGLYSQVANHWVRFVTNNGQFAFYDDSGIGTTPDVTIDGGDLTITGDLNVGGTINAISRSNVYYVQRNNASGANTQNLGAQANKLCFLTQSGFRDIDAADEIALCKVAISGNNWILSAELGNTNDADAYCGAQCISW